jgi:hypothetical protein
MLFYNFYNTNTNLFLTNFFNNLILHPYYSRYFFFIYKFSFVTVNPTFIDLNVYETKLNLIKDSSFLILWYLFSFNLKKVNIIIPCYKNFIFSQELLFSSLKWVEREFIEFFGVFFLQKSDNRTLYSIPLFYTFPFLKRFPTVGFYELFLCPFSKILYFSHVSFKI